MSRGEWPVRAGGSISQLQTGRGYRGARCCALRKRVAHAERHRATSYRQACLLATILELGRCAFRERQRSEEHTSELQSPCNLVCRLLLEKKKKNETSIISNSIYLSKVVICREI